MTRLGREPVLALVELERVDTGRKTVVAYEDYRQLSALDRAGTIAIVFVRCTSCGTRNDIKGGLAELAAAINGFDASCTHGRAVQ